MVNGLRHDPKQQEKLSIPLIKKSSLEFLKEMKKMLKMQIVLQRKPISMANGQRHQQLNVIKSSIKVLILLNVVSKNKLNLRHLTQGKHWKRVVGIWKISQGSFVTMQSLPIKMVEKSLTLPFHIHIVRLFENLSVFVPKSLHGIIRY